MSNPANVMTELFLNPKRAATWSAHALVKDEVGIDRHYQRSQPGEERMEPIHRCEEGTCEAGTLDTGAIDGTPSVTAAEQSPISRP